MLCHHHTAGDSGDHCCGSHPAVEEGHLTWLQTGGVQDIYIHCVFCLCNMCVAFVGISWFIIVPMVDTTESFCLPFWHFRFILFGMVGQWHSNGLTLKCRSNDIGGFLKDTTVSALHATRGIQRELYGSKQCKSRMWPTKAARTRVDKGTDKAAPVE